MRKRLKPVPKQDNSLKDFLQTYDVIALRSSLETFEGGFGWNLFKAYAQMVQRQYEVDALDMVAKHDMQHAASFASGYAKGISDLVETFVQGLQETINGRNQLVEAPRPEE